MTRKKRSSAWSVWQLPLAARFVVLTGITGYLAALAAAVWELLHGAPLHAPAYRQLAVAGAFAFAAVASAEISMRFAWPRARQDRVSRDLMAVWLLPIALLLPPAYVMVTVIVLRGYLYARVWRAQLLKNVYTATALGLAYGGASLVHRLVLHATMDTNVTASQFTRGGVAAASLALAVATYWIVNALLIAAVVIMTAGADAVRSFLKDREGLVVDAVAACLGTLAAVLWATEPMLAVLLLPPVLLLEHQLFSGLRQAVRTDLLTDVANPQHWREVAGREVERAAASDDNLAILMIDVDHFKSVNDRYGHLAGDQVLAAVARTIAQALRPRDLVGRLGGEEFGAVLSGLNLLDAEGAAERLRTQVRDIRVRADSGEWISVTVSVGVSELSVTGGDLHRLLDAADTALYVAKAAGRDCVRVAAPEPGVVIDLSTPTAEQSTASS
ncbi:MAG TPA: GGDEF domain-containing protein [Acidothermaceae bacterium]|nr:GGDEF domain-containing protein [Acidothermaceae bacterium]